MTEIQKQLTDSGKLEGGVGFRECLTTELSTEIGQPCAVPTHSITVQLTLPAPLAPGPRSLFKNMPQIPPPPPRYL